ncbi:MAG: NDP-sugar synthase [Desulfarculaceae bacterium]|nr:NDP-sugar synthase [Desulfarculaceae bacterium]MCF8070978.1 NDP-sugar synthase [Desulfarculaceae bacterium]MCF8100566.1 NDP-sugar synthase [Desulfarculaceae bacterium]MCF8116592.1 NDP-sugar synthase [Desulfarculaceae bacterium]
MRAMILAAGLGNRMRPLTNKRPKCLMPVMNRPLLGLWLERLADWGVERAVVNTHHLAPLVEQWLAGRAPGGPEVVISPEPEILGTGGGLVAARPALGEEPFLLVNSDLVATAHVPDLLEPMEARKAVAVLGLVDEPRFGNTVGLDREGRVLGFRRQDELSPPRWLTYTGLAAIHPRLLDYLPATGYSTLVEGLRAAIAAGEKVWGAPLEGFWDNLGTPEDLLRMHSALFTAPPPGLEALAPAGPVVLAPGAELSREAEVEGFAVLGPGVVVEAGARLKDSLLLPGVRVEAGASVSGAVLGDGFAARGRLQGGAYA